MVRVNKSFLWGSLCASLTWSVSFYLYWRLTNTSMKTITSYAPTPNLVDNNLHNSKKSRNDFPFRNEKWKYKDQNKDDDVRIFNIQKTRYEKESDKNNRLEKYDKSKMSFNEKMKRYQADYKKKMNKNSNALIESLQPIAKENSELDELGMVHTSEEQRMKDDGYKRHAFNVLVSNKISYHRDILDTRNALCEKETYPENLPDTSIIICFYNEHLMTLLRSIYSVFIRTPEHLLKELILVDDYSDDLDIKDNLEKQLHQMFNDKSGGNLNPEWVKKIHLIRAKRREGLIRARVIGSRNATGEVLVFLDSHIEVNQDWVQPLLTRILLNSTTVVMPVIDIINPDTFKYTPSPLVRGGFNWGLHFKWDNLPKGTLVKNTDFIKPIRSPTMAGGLFAMDRQYFKDLGEYDMGMEVWGGENLEISFRIWMCGGTLELIPCSHVGHVFRRRRPYGSGVTDSMLKNSLRVAHVWLDEFKQYFLKDHEAAKDMFYGDISERKLLREQLKCKTFKWYLDNVYPERLLPGEKSKGSFGNFQPWHSRKRNYTSSYQIRLSGTNLCVTSAGDDPWKRGGVLTLQACLRVKHQTWSETIRSELVLGQLLCLDASSSRDPTLGKCHEMGGDQEWKHKGENGTPIYNMASGTCLGVPQDAIKGTVINMIMCSNEDAYKLKWDLVR